MSTGDLHGNSQRLVRELRVIRFPAVVDEVGVKLGDPAALLPLLHHVLLKFSRHVATRIAAAGYELRGKTDQRFVEGVFKLCRDTFNIRTVLTPSQFLEKGYAERKVLLLCDVIHVCKKIHDDEIRKQRLGSLRTSRQSPSDTKDSLGGSAARRVPQVKVVRNEDGATTRHVLSVSPGATGSDGAQSLYQVARRIDQPSHSHSSDAGLDDTGDVTSRAATPPVPHRSQVQRTSPSNTAATFLADLDQLELTLNPRHSLLNHPHAVRAGHSSNGSGGSGTPLYDGSSSTSQANRSSSMRPLSRSRGASSGPKGGGLGEVAEEASSGAQQPSRGASSGGGGSGSSSHLPMHAWFVNPAFTDDAPGGGSSGDGRPGVSPVAGRGAGGGAVREVPWWSVTGSGTTPGLSSNASGWPVWAANELQPAATATADEAAGPRLDARRFASSHTTSKLSDAVSVTTTLDITAQRVSFAPSKPPAKSAAVLADAPWLAEQYTTLQPKAAVHGGTVSSTMSAAGTGWKAAPAVASLPASKSTIGHRVASSTASRTVAQQYAQLAAAPLSAIVDRSALARHRRFSSSSSGSSGGDVVSDDENDGREATRFTTGQRTTAGPSSTIPTIAIDHPAPATSVEGSSRGDANFQPVVPSRDADTEASRQQPTLPLQSRLPPALPHAEPSKASDTLSSSIYAQQAPRQAPAASPAQNPTSAADAAAAAAAVPSSSASSHNAADPARPSSGNAYSQPYASSAIASSGGPHHSVLVKPSAPARPSDEAVPHSVGQRHADPATVPPADAPFRDAARHQGSSAVRQTAGGTHDTGAAAAAVAEVEVRLGGRLADLEGDLAAQVEQLSRRVADTNLELQQSRAEAARAREELQARSTVLEGRVRFLEAELRALVNAQHDRVMRQQQHSGHRLSPLRSVGSPASASGRPSDMFQSPYVRAATYHAGESPQQYYQNSRQYHSPSLQDPVTHTFASPLQYNSSSSNDIGRAAFPAAAAAAAHGGSDSVAAARPTSSGTRFSHFSSLPGGGSSGVPPVLQPSSLTEQFAAAQDAMAQAGLLQPHSVPPDMPAHARFAAEHQALRPGLVSSTSSYRQQATAAGGRLELTKGAAGAVELTEPTRGTAGTAGAPLTGAMGLNEAGNGKAGTINASGAARLAEVASGRVGDAPPAVAASSTSALIQGLASRYAQADSLLSSLRRH